MCERLNSEQQALVENNMKLVPYCIDRILASERIPKYDYEDMLQTGYMALTKAALLFDSGKGAAFSTYATRAIFIEMARYGRKDSEAPQLMSREQADLMNATLSTESEEFIVDGGICASEFIGRLVVGSDDAEAAEKVLQLIARGYERKDIKRELSMDGKSLDRLLRRLAYRGRKDPALRSLLA